VPALDIDAPRQVADYILNYFALDKQ